MTSRSLIPMERELDTFHDIGREVGRLTSQMERMFDEFFGERAYEPRLFRFRREWPEWRFTPSCDVSESESSYVLRAEVPGFSKDELHVDVSEGVVTLKGEKKQEEEKEGQRYVCRESCSTSFERSFRLPEEIDVESVQAKLKEGVLTLTLPKTRAQHLKQIEVVEEQA